MIRWGIIGCGDIARKRVARAIQADPNSELVAACRRDTAKLRSFCDEFSVVRGVPSADELIGSDDLEAVYVATPVNLHCEQSCAAAEQGKHVLVEKPMAMSVAECNLMIDCCKRNGVQLGVAYYRRFYPVIHRIKQLITAGGIGRPLSALALSGSPFHLQPGDDGYWRANPTQSGGGPIMDIGSHRIDLLLELFGTVHRVRSCVSTGGRFEVEDSAAVLIEFGSGAHAVLQCYYGASDVPDHFAVVGTEGRLVVDPLNQGELRIEVNRQTRIESHPPADNLHGPLVEDFSQSVLKQRKLVVTGEDGRAVNEIIQQAYDSAAQ